MLSNEDTTVMESANDDTAVTIEPQVGGNQEDSLSSISDVPTVAHFNISVRDLQYCMVYHKGSSYSLFSFL